MDGEWKRSCRSWRPVTRGTFGGGQYHNCLPSCQTLKARQAVGCDEIRPEMLKPWITKEFLAWVVCFKWLGVLDGHRSWNIPIQKTGGMNAPTTWAFLSLSSLKKYMPGALKKDTTKYFNQTWMLPNTVFVQAVALQTRFSLSSKFSTNLGCMSKTSAHVWSPSRKDTTEFFRKSLGECCVSAVLIAAFYC